MIPIEQLTKEQAAGIRYILTDIDDTITTEGKLPACAYTAMWRLHDAGYKVIPVTGRSCGWCDLIAREWPAAAVVGENGAVVYYMENGHLKVFTHPSVAGDEAVSYTHLHRGIHQKRSCLPQAPASGPIFFPALPSKILPDLHVPLKFLPPIPFLPKDAGIPLHSSQPGAVR